MKKKERTKKDVEKTRKIKKREKNIVKEKNKEKENEQEIVKKRENERGCGENQKDQKKREKYSEREK